MKWLQNLEKQLQKRDKKDVFIINDSKTPSGKVHVGSLRGVLIHDVASRYLKSKGYNVKFIYGIDDYDTLDGLPVNASQSLKDSMGKPLCNIPAPDESCATDLADYYIQDFLKIFKELGVQAEIYRMRDIYRSGKFNKIIDTILQNANEIRDIYLKISNSKKDKNWYPFQVICEKCGKLGTTIVTNYENDLVDYECRENLVTWAKGCGNIGKISPFNGNGKLPWKLEWTAKWNYFGIDIEGAGEDHCIKNGSRDVANACFIEIFKKHIPINIPYGFFLISGSKMSSSKGIGFSARDMTNFLPPEILRYIMISSNTKKAINFSIDLNKMFKIFNEYDRLLENKDDILTLTEVDKDIGSYQTLNFQILTTFVQIPNFDILEEMKNRFRREPTNIEKQSLEKRVKSVKYWLKNYGTDEDKFQIQEEEPLIIKTLTESQKEFLITLNTFIQNNGNKEENIKNEIYNIARTTPISASDAFQAIYKAILNKSYGPKIWTLLSAIDLAFLNKRFKNLSINKNNFLNEVIINYEEKKNNIKKIILEENITKDVKKVYFINQKDRKEVYFYKLEIN